MKLNIRTKLAGVLIAGVGLAVAMPALPAVGLVTPPAPTIQIKTPGIIRDHGAVVFVTLRMACPAGDSAFPEVKLTERSGNVIAQGFGGQEVACTGDFQKVTIPVTPSSAPFVIGQAFAQANFFVCDIDTCRQLSAARTILLKK